MGDKKEKKERFRKFYRPGNQSGTDSEQNGEVTESAETPDSSAADAVGAANDANIDASQVNVDPQAGADAEQTAVDNSQANADAAQTTVDAGQDESAESKVSGADTSEGNAGGAGDGSSAFAADTAGSADSAGQTTANKQSGDNSKQFQELNDRYLRLMAEYDNFKRRSARERQAIYADVRGETVSRFLPVYDNLKRALEAHTEDEAYKKGVEMTFTQLCEVMRKLGVEEIEALGKTFDPQLHNAVMHIEDENEGENVIVQEFEKGFKMGDKVIRFSTVKVAN